jgi:hypothetical protein
MALAQLEITATQEELAQFLFHATHFCLPGVKWRKRQLSSGKRKRLNVML